MGAPSRSIHGVYDEIVVGGGIMGSCIAYEVAKRGRRVLLLERFHLLHSRGSSHGESRTIRLTYPQEYYTAMALEAFRLWQAAEQEAGYRVLTPTPHLDIGLAAEVSLTAAIASCRKHGVEVELLHGHDASSRFPALVNLPEDWIAVATPRGGVIHASKAVAMFQSLAVKNGAVLRDRTVVRRINPGWKLPDGTDGVLVISDNGAAFGRNCIIAAGAWTRTLAMEISDIELPIQAVRTAIAYWQIETTHSDAFSVAHGFPTFASYGHPYIYGTPSLEYPGLIKVSHHSGYACDIDDPSVATDVDSLMKHVSPWLATFFAGKIKSESPVIVEPCLYSMTPDEDYILDFLPLKDGGKGSILVAAGFSGHGFKMGPVVGRIMADLALTGVSEGIPLECFSISRFLGEKMREFKNQVSIYAKSE